MSGRRLPAMLMLVGLLVVLGVLSREGEPTTTVRFGSAIGAHTPTAAPAGAIGSAWYCAAGTAARGAGADLTVVIANVGDEERTGTVTWFPSGGGERSTEPVSVEPDTITSVAAAATVDAPIVSALVELDGGEVAVEHTISGLRGNGVAPCATQASTRWFFANGITERDASQVLALFNPFPDDAVVDFSFATDEGRDEPRLLQGLPVAAGTTSFVKVQDFVRRRAVTAVSIVARTGRLVVDRVQSFDGSAGRSGVSLALGAPAPAETWSFPDGLYGEGLTQTWHVYNPSDREAEVSLEIVPAAGDAPQPVDITVSPRSVQTLDASAIERIGPLVPHSSTIRSLNGVGVVAERAVWARRPASRRGWSSSLGAPDGGRRWIFPVGEANGNTDEWIVVHNPGARTVTVSVYALAGGQRLPIEDLQDLDISAAGRLGLRLGDHISRTPLPILVEATGDVVAERDAYSVTRVGLSTIIGIRAR